MQVCLGEAPLNVLPELKKWPLDQTQGLPQGVGGAAVNSVQQILRSFLEEREAYHQILPFRGEVKRHASHHC